MNPDLLPDDAGRRRRLASIALATAALVAACAQPGGPASYPAPTPAPAPRPAPPAAPVAPAPTPPTAPAPTEPPVAPSPQAAQRYTVSAIELLEQGREDEAVAELRRALQADPGHRLAQSMLRQVEADPVATLGRESFPYRVQPGESLSRIAQRFLGDVHLFYILARYNDIPVPRQLQGGQTIRIPGKAPPPSAAVPPAPPPAAPAPPPAAPPPPAPAPAGPDPKAREAAAEQDRIARIAVATRAARAAFARQDLDTAIRQWTLVLELDPGNSTAQLERRRAIELRDRLSRVPQQK